MAWRAWSSSNMPACAGTAAKAVPATQAAAANRSQEKRCVIRLITRYLLLVHEVGAAVLCPRRFVMTRGLRLFLAEAHGFHLRVRHAHQRQRTAHGFSTLLAECQVVLARAALVGIALDQHVALRMALQVLR